MPALLAAGWVTSAAIGVDVEQQFTVFGAADRTPRLAAEGGDAGRRPLRVWPNPSRGLTRIAGPPGERIVVLDLAGRVVREAALDASRGEFVWDGRDRAAGRVRPGLYFVRAASGVARAQRIVRIE